MATRPLSLARPASPSARALAGLSSRKRGAWSALAGGGGGVGLPVLTGLVADYDAIAQLDAGALVGVDIATLTDFSGEGNDLTPTDSDRCQIVSSGIGGKPAFSFPGTTGYQTTLAAIVTDYTAFIVLQSATGTGWAVALGGNDTSGTDNSVYPVSVNNSDKVSQWAGGTFQNGPLVGTGERSIAARRTSGTGYLNVDGTLVSAAAVGTRPIALLGLGSKPVSPTSSGNSWNGKIARGLVYNRPLTDLEIADVREALFTIYGV